MATELYQFICPKCTRSLVWTFCSSKVYCPVCHKWVKFRDLNNPRTEIVSEPEIIADDIEIEQLTMF
jgi:hypothetical protein